MNRLQFETSPYLLQHAGNPVDWHAWKPAALDRARAEDKPILLSIGYSTCHWCHVMERESFEDEATAAFMNRHFINIKVDREERPDVDQIYMEACQAFSGSCGWPLNCFLLPDGRPFFAGTYYPPQPAHNRPSWRQLMENIVVAYHDRRQEVEKQADQLTSIMQRSDSIFIEDGILSVHEADNRFSTETADRISAQLRLHFDTRHGGFGGAPKFPATMALQFLLDYHHFSGNEPALRHAEWSLERMIRGGIYDQLGGGFARYATDREWLIPHFEKMLYDNALLVSLLASAYQLTGKALFREAIDETLAFIAREMTSPEGGFYSALDADSEGEEGRFYVWQQEEIDRLLGDDAPLFSAFYGCRPGGNWEGQNILWRPETLANFAASRQLDPSELAERLARCRQVLLEARAKRIRPGLDDKILLSWNALMATAYARAAAALGDVSYREAARRNLHFLLDRLAIDEGPALYHTYKEGQAQYEAFLDDYAFLIEALLEVYGITFEDKYLELAATYTELVNDRFLDTGSGYFFYTSEAQTDILLRRKELYDSALPSGNSTMVLNLLRLGLLLGREDYRKQALQMLAGMEASILKYPTSFARWAGALARVAYPFFEVAIVGQDAMAKAEAANRLFLPNAVLMASAEARDDYPLLAGKQSDEEALIYVCREYACQAPVKSVEEMKKLVSS